MKPATIKYIEDENKYVLMRPDIYVGNVYAETVQAYVLDEEAIILKEVTYIPALLKIFNEILSNSIDEAVKTKFKKANRIEISIDPESFTFSVIDNGRGLPIEIDEQAQMYKPQLAFTKLRAGSNFDGSESIGRFGVGAALTNIFSKQFHMETWNNGQKFQLKCSNNNSCCFVSTSSGVTGSGTSVTYIPDLQYFSDFKPEMLDDLLGLIQKMIYDAAMIFPAIHFYFNNTPIQTSFEDYVKMYQHEGHTISEHGSIKLAVFSGEGFEPISFVNGIPTYRGGTHVDFVTTKIVESIRKHIEKTKKYKIKPMDIRNRLGIILSVLGMKDPKFDSQTKERLTSPISELAINVEERFLKKVCENSQIIDPIIESHEAKMKQKTDAEIRSKRKEISKKTVQKLIDSKERMRSKCTLFITEGDSATSTFILVRQSYHAALPLRGKVLNVSGCSDKEVLENKELQNIMAAVGLKLHKPAENLRYGKIVILTDQDVDGHSITALLLNFFHRYWPELFKEKIVSKYISPIIIAKRGKEVQRFYRLSDYEKKKADLEGWNITYNKGLGGLDVSEYSRMINNPVEYVFDAANASDWLTMAFGEDAEKRKEWLHAANV